MKSAIISFAFIAVVSAGAVSYVKRSDDANNGGLDTLTSLGYGSTGIESYGDGGDHKDYYAYPKYKFEYGVKDPHTGDHKSQWETRDGDVVKGEYTLDEADGTKRVVEYHADGKTGFHAKVKKIGHAHHPSHYGSGFGY
jgi:Insect cuticle protein